MSVQNPNNNVSKQDLADFYQAIYPYLGGSIQVATMPTASATFYGKTLQYVGATDANYTHNYFYECVSDGQSTPTYSWQVTNVQAGSSGSSTLSGLTDTDIESPTDGQLLGYNNTSGKWENKNAPEADTSKCFKTDDTAETALADADTIPFYDNSASAKRKSTWSNIKSVLKTYFDTLYNKYTLPTASASTLGGVKVGDNLSISNGVLTATLPAVGTINRSDIYDTTEKVIGKWTDGRPLYQKVITTTIPTTSTDGTNGESYISVGVSVSTYVGLNAFFNATSSQFAPLPFIQLGSGTVISSSTGNNLGINVLAYNNSDSNYANKIRIQNSKTTFNSKSITIIVQYTKTTDSANSYNYANENDYSTSEKIVGTWIDGSYLYQKTIEVTIPTTTEGNWAHVYASLTSVSNVIEFKGSYKTSQVIVPIPWTTNSGASCKVFYDIASSRIDLSTNNPAIGGLKAYITVTYIK